MISWQQITNTDGVNPDYFSEYKNENGGLLTRIAVNMRPLVQRSILPESMRTEEKFFYFCTACKVTDSEKMSSIFKKYNPNQPIIEASIRYNNEIGFILWVAYNKEAKKNLEQVFETISDSEKLGEEGLPEIIKEKVREKVTSCLGEELVSSK